MSLLDKIDTKRLPQHVAIIMDGNGRWAKARGEERYVGHQEGVVSVLSILPGYEVLHDESFHRDDILVQRY